MAKMAELALPNLELEEANTQLQAPETNVESSKDPLRIYQEKVEKMSSEIKVSQTSEPPRKWMMDLEVRQGHAESIRYFVIICIMGLPGVSVDTPGSVQFFKSVSYAVLTNMELRYRYRQHLRDYS